MLNAKKFQYAAAGPFSLCNFSVTTTLADGATPIPFGSKIPSYIPPLKEAPTISGDFSYFSALRSLSSLARGVAASDYAARLADIAFRIEQARETSTVTTLLSQGTRALGAERAVFISFALIAKHISACDFILACEPDWCRNYLDEDLFGDDIWLAYAAHHSEPILASALKPTRAAQIRAINLANKYGFASAVLIPAHCGVQHSRVGLLCLGSSVPGFFEEGRFKQLKISARVIALELHDWWIGRIRRELIAKANLTTKDLVLLTHQHKGHSSKRIAAELHVSQESINSHFQRMNVKLGVSHRKLAARLASECGLITG